MATPLNTKSVVSALLARSVDTIEIRTRFSPPVILKVADLVTGEGEPGVATQLLKPTVVLSGGSLGTQIIAPAGEASRDEWQWWSFAVGTLAVVGTFTVLVTVFKLGERRGRR